MQSDNSLASFIDHTLLKPEASTKQIHKLCDEALLHHFHSVCVNSSWVETCSHRLMKSEVSVCAVVGFPLGTMDNMSKAYETQQAISNGASEIDMVLHIGALKDLRYDYVREDIRGVVTAAQGRWVKVIIETALLSDEEKFRACEISREAGAHFVKTCTGFNGGAASVEDIQLMKRAVEGKLQIKASGGIKDPAFALALIQAGASRLGTSAGVALMQGYTSQGGY